MSTVFPHCRDDISVLEQGQCRDDRCLCLLRTEIIYCRCGAGYTQINNNWKHMKKCESNKVMMAVMEGFNNNKAV